MDARPCFDLDALPDPTFVIGPDGCLARANAAAGLVLGWDPQAWVGRTVYDLVHPDDLAVVLSSMVSVQSDGRELGSAVEVRVRHAEEGWRWLEVVGRTVRGPDGAFVVCTGRDLTARRRWEVSGSDAAQLATVLQHAPVITMLLDDALHVRGVNGAFTRILGWDPIDVVGGPLCRWAVDGEVPSLAAALAHALTCHATTTEVRLRTADGGERPIRLETVNLLDDPVVAGLIVAGTDVSELAQARRDLAHVVRHDGLTGLPNRDLALDALRAVIGEGRRPAVLHVDLDGFKPVNDLLGLRAGDELLQEAARRLATLRRPGDVLARIGGDEFVIVVADASADLVADLAQRVEAAVEQPFLLGAGIVHVGATVGSALFVPGASAEDLLAEADIAMDDVKAARRGARRSSSRRSGRHLVDALPGAIDDGQIQAFLQPIVRADDGSVDGVEALARWVHPTEGVVPPADFLDLADDTGLAGAVGDVILASACRSLAALPSSMTPTLALNLSVQQLTDPTLPDRVAAICAVYGFPLDRLHVEITEQAALERKPAAGRVTPDTSLRALHAMGCRLVLDDFGTGYSSLTHVRRFPLHAIKVDRLFVTGCVHSAEDRGVISAVVGLGRALGMQVVAEGVENEDQAAVLRSLHVDLLQGFLFSRPRAPDDAVQWLSEHPTSTLRSSHRPLVR